MAKSNKRTNELEDYIRQVEAKEKNKKKKYIILSFLIVGVLGLSYIPYHLISQKSAFRSFRADELSIYMVDSIFEADSTRIVINNGEGKLPDTIASVEGYIDLTSPESSAAMDSLSLQIIKFENDSIEDGGDEEIQYEKGVPNQVKKTKLPQYYFALEGNKVVGESIQITIIDYDENVNYEIEFGNGVKRRIRKRTTYSYPKAGNFLINLIATNTANTPSIYKRSISIQPKPADKSDESQTQIANNSNSEQQSQPISESLLASAESDEADNLFAEIIDNASSANQLSDLETPSRNILNLTDENEEAKEKEVNNMTPKVTGPLISAEKQPSFPGGEAAMYKFLSRKMRYPRLARDNNVEGKVYLQFVVEADGTLSNIKVLRGIDYGCDEEAIRVLRQMPRWIPGEQGGQKVPVYYTIRVSFRIQN